MKTKVIKIFLTGSGTFFSNMPDYEPHDIDELCIIDHPLFGERTPEMRKDGIDSFFIFNFGKDKLIDICIKENTPMAICKFLSPEFAEYINLTIDDLKRLDELVAKMDNKHSYLKTIYDYYIYNNSFKLTDEQLKEVYEEYKNRRK